MTDEYDDIAPDDLTPEQLDELIAESERLGAEITEEEHREFMARMAERFDTKAWQALLELDLDRADILNRLAEAAEREAER